MKSAHDNIVRLADKLRLTDKTRGLLIKMRKDVLEKVRLNLKAIKNTSQNPWKITLKQEITTGSLDRWTAVEKSSDIDVVVAFNFKPIDGGKKCPSSRDLMKIIELQIPDGYHSMRKKRSVEVTKKIRSDGKDKTIRMDIVPVIVEVGKNVKQTTWWRGVSKVRPQRGWVQLNPNHQKDMMKKLSRRKDQKDDPSALIICLKRWRDVHEKKGAPCELPSYVLEVLVWEDYKKFPEAIDDLTDRFNRILKKFNRINTKGVSFSKMMGDSHRPKGSKVATGKPLLHDPSNTSVNLVEHIDRQDLSWWGERATKASSNDISFGKIFQ